MIYTVIIGDRSYDLPKKTLAITEKLDATAKVDEVKGISTREKYKRILDCISALLGAEAVREALGSDDIAEVDLSEVVITFRKIVDAYNKPVQDYQMMASMGALDGFPVEKLTGMANAVTQIIDAAGAADKT